MIYKVLFFLILGMTMLDADPQNYGISLEKESTKKGDHYSLFQNGKLVDTFEDYRIDILLNELKMQSDLDKDGYDEMILYGWSGGNHCCFTLKIATMKPNMSKLYQFELHNAILQPLKDLDGDGIVEFVYYDDVLAYFGSLCFACSPGIKVIANYKNGRLILRPGLIRKHSMQSDDLFRSSKVWLADEEILELNSKDAPQVLSRFLYHLYSGSYITGVKFINEFLHFDTPKTKEHFYSTLIKRLATNIFWDQLKKQNNLVYSNARVFSDKEVLNIFMQVSQ